MELSVSRGIDRKHTSTFGKYTVVMWRSSKWPKSEYKDVYVCYRTDRWAVPWGVDWACPKGRGGVGWNHLLMMGSVYSVDRTHRWWCSALVRCYPELSVALGSSQTIKGPQEEHLFGLRTKDFNIIFFNFTTRVLFAQLITSFLLVWITLYLSDY